MQRPHGRIEIRLVIEEKNKKTQIFGYDIGFEIFKLIVGFLIAL